MPYTPQTWVDNNASYPLSAARMNTIESGISTAASTADQGHRILTTVQRDALTGVTAGTMIYNTTLNRIQVYFNSAWVDADQFRTVGANNYSNRIVPPSARLIRSSSLTSYTSGSAITWSSAALDTDGMFAAGSPTVLTVQSSGIYVITFNAYVTGSPTFSYSLPKISRNGTSVCFAYSFGVSNETGFAISTIRSLNAGDTVSASVQISGGSAYVVQGSATEGEGQSSLAVAWIGRAS